VHTVTIQTSSVLGGQTNEVKEEKWTSEGLIRGDETQTLQRYTSDLYDGEEERERERENLIVEVFIGDNFTEQLI